MKSGLFTFKSFYTNYELTQESIVLDRSTEKILVNGKPDNNNIELVSPVFYYGPITGSQTVAALKANPLYRTSFRVFYGYDVVPFGSSKEDLKKFKDIKLRIYAAFKGIAGEIKKIPYSEPDWTDP